jgi:hypothetical protein
MKLVNLRQLEPIKVKSIDVEPDTKEMLDMYQEYLKEVDGEEVKIEDIIAGCVEIALKKIDKDFLRWFRNKKGIKTRGRKKAADYPVDEEGKSKVVS